MCGIEEALKPSRAVRPDPDLVDVRMEHELWMNFLPPAMDWTKLGCQNLVDPSKNPEDLNPKTPKP